MENREENAKEYEYYACVEEGKSQEEETKSSEVGEDRVRTHSGGREIVISLDCLSPRTVNPFPIHSKIIRKLQSKLTSKDWNKEYQELYTISRKDLKEKDDDLPQEQLSRSIALRKLALRFASVACKIGIIIIKELYLQDQLKTIPSVIAGGFAGGEKYQCCGIFFKLSRDWVGLYGGDAYAMKAAEHELKGTMSYVDCRIEGLHTPLMALIRYRGYVIIAQSLLPINKSTIIYGTSDSAITVHNDDPEFSEKIKLAAQILNLKEHVVWNRSHTNSALLHTAVDVEGHLGMDDRFYIIDTARVFPPVAPIKKSGQGNTVLKSKGRHLYELMRPEFVKLNPVPLSSDGFSRFGSDDSLRKSLNNEILMASNRLRAEVIPAFATYLDHRIQMQSNSISTTPESGVGSWSSSSSISFSLLRSEFLDTDLSTLQEEISNLVPEMHLHGINARFLIHIFELLVSPRMRTLVATEAVARTTKHLMEQRWRLLNSVDEEKYVTRLREFLNIVFGSKENEESMSFWKNVLSKEVYTHFKPSDLSVGECKICVTDPKFSLLVYVDKVLLCSRLMDLLGVTLGLPFLRTHQFKDSIHHSQSEPPHSKSQSSLISSSKDYDKSPGRLRASTAGDSLSIDLWPILEEEDVAEEGDLAMSPVMEDEYVTYAKFLALPFCFEDVQITIKPRVKHIHRISFEEGTALSRMAVAKSTAGEDEKAYEFFSRANSKFKEALQIKPNDVRALYNWAFSLSKQAEIVGGDESKRLWTLASEKYNRCLVLHPHDCRALWKWGTTLCIQAEHETGEEKQFQLYRSACSKLNKAAMLMGKHFETRCNAGNASLHYSRLLEKAYNAAKSKEDQITVVYGQRIHQVLNRAIGHYKATLQIKEDFVPALHNLAIAYATKARLLNLPEASVTEGVSMDLLYGDCYECFRKALKLSTQNHQLLAGWGNALFRHVMSKDISTATDTGILQIWDLLSQAAEKYKLALILNAKIDINLTQMGQNTHLNDSLTNLGNILLFWEKSKPTEKLKNLENEFQENFNVWLKIFQKWQEKIPFSVKNTNSKVLSQLIHYTNEAPNKKDTILILKSLNEEQKQQNQKSPEKSQRLELSSSNRDEVVTTPKKRKSHHFTKTSSSPVKKNSVVQIDDGAYKSISSPIKGNKDVIGDSPTKKVGEENFIKKSLFRTSSRGSGKKCNSEEQDTSRRSIASLFRKRSSSRKSWDVESKTLVEDVVLDEPLKKSHKGKLKKAFDGFKKPHKKHSETPIQKLKVVLDYDNIVLYAHDLTILLQESDFELKDVLGKCRNGLVFSVVKDGITFAMKCRNKKELTTLPSELFIYDHPCVSKILYIYHTETKLFFISQLIEGMQLTKFLEQRLKKTKEMITEEQLSFYMAQIISAIEYIQLDSIYMDFKPENILITTDGNICISVHDEGESEMYDLSVSSFQFTHKSYLAPEVVFASLGDDYSSITPHHTIWWSIGLYFYKLATGHSPFVDARSNQKQNILNEPVVFPTTISKPLASLLEKLLQRDPKLRLTDPSHIKAQPFFASIDWTTICDFHQNRPPLQFKQEEAEPFFPVPTESNSITQIDTQPQSLDFGPTPTWLAPVLADDLVGSTLVGLPSALLKFPHL